MADFDTKVLYLETPPTSAPKASYIIGVRVKNLGLFPTATSGYVQVFDKDTGDLVKTYSVASAVLDPDEEKQAFAFEVWDLTEEETGKQFILSGMVTSEGDTDPSNDILNPTILTVTEAPPPPPPPVTPHVSQHEDGGNDEMSVEGLHGQLKDPQPYADHASKHQNGGEDELSVAGLGGNLADPQIPTDHGNERHVESYATETQLDNHNEDPDPHDAATTLEKTAEKGQVDGYAELDGGGKVPAAQLPGLPPVEHGADKHDATVEETSAKGIANGYAGLDATAFVPPDQLADTAGGADTLFLRGDQVWASPAGTAGGTPNQVTAGIAPAEGSSDLVARADHEHGGAGGLGIGASSGPIAPTVYTAYLNTIKAGTVQDFYNVCLELDHFGYVQSDPGPGLTMQVDLEVGLDLGSMVVRDTLVFSWNPALSDAAFSILGKLYSLPTSCWAASRAHVLGCPAGCLILSLIGATAVIDWSVDQVVRVQVTLTGAGIVTRHFVDCNINGESRSAPA